MSYVLKSLIAGESINYRAQLHWWIFTLPILLLLLGLWFVFVWINLAPFFSYVGTALIALSILGVINRILMIKTCDFVVTNKRVILKTGFFRRRVSELQLNKAEAIIFDESILGRLFGFGTIIVTTGGGTNTYPYIASPLLFRKAINEGIDNMNKERGTR